MKSRIILWTIVVLLLTPLWMRLIWMLSPRKVFNIMIVDKTVMNENSTKHRSVNWILDHEKYCKPDSNYYDINTDYFGFFPAQNDKYATRDFDNLSVNEVDSISNAYDMIYYTDTYGILANEWYSHHDRSEISHNIYGGLSEKDLLMLGQMKDKKKLILSEFNTIGYPTPLDVRQNFEDMFKIHWTGWIARYISSLDTIDNPDLPKWIVRAYKKQNEGVWDFKKPGILFLHEEGTVLVLESERDLKDAIPVINSNSQSQSQFQIPSSLIYPYWMEIIENKSDTNRVVSHFVINANTRGGKILADNHLPAIFPAIIQRTGDYRFFYFAGDFADNPTKFRFAKLTGITGLKFLMYNVKDQTDRNRFFWEFYLPLMQNIFENYYNQVPRTRATR